MTPLRQGKAIQIVSEMHCRGHVPTTTVIVLIRRTSVYGMEVNPWKQSEGRRTLTSKSDIEPTTAGSSKLGMERTLIQEDIRKPAGPRGNVEVPTCALRTTTDILRIERVNAQQ